MTSIWPRNAIIAANESRRWLDNDYRPMQARFAAFLARNGTSEAAAAIVAEEENDITLYERHSAFVSYGYTVVERIAALIEQRCALMSRRCTAQGW